MNIQSCASFKQNEHGAQNSFSLGVVITTYNSPLWLEHVLTGYECQDDADFEIIIADDGSDDKTREVIDRFKERKLLNICHVWHEDVGFRKTEILNKALQATEADYLIFTDGDCIPRADFVSLHRALARPGCFLSGGYLKLPMGVSRSISENDIRQQNIFNKSWLIKHGQPLNLKLLKLVRSTRLVRLLSRFTPTKPTWNGMNSSAWRKDLLEVNGFNERMQYGGLDRELGERLWNHGLKSMQIRFMAICVHLDHKRGYATSEIWERNYAIRKEVRRSGQDWTPFGIVKETRPHKTLNNSTTSDFELILGNSNRRFSGVTSTMLQVLAAQKERVSLVVLGQHHLPKGVPVVTFWQLARLARRPLPGGRWRVFHARRNDEMIQALLLRFLFQAKIKIVFTSTAQRPKTWITRWLMRRMDGLLSTCSAAAAYMPSSPDRIIPHGIDCRLYQPVGDRARLWSDLGLPGQYGVGIFGRVRSQKGVDLLIEAALKVLPDFPDFSVVVVGEITSDQVNFVNKLKQKIESAGLMNRVVFTGKLPFEQIPAFFRAMSIVTALSRTEGFGLTVLEAMSCGVPVIATRAGAWPDIIEDGVDGYLIDIGDANTLETRLRTLMMDEKRRQTMGENSRRKVVTEYTVEREAEALLDYYRSLV